MKSIPIQVKDDFLESISKVTPTLAIQELIWNGLDADASEVRVTFELSEMGGVTGIRVWDDGEGIAYGDVSESFGRLGGSWKRHSSKTRARGRTIHGKAGRGKFRAFRLGQRIAWLTRHSRGLMTEAYAISADLQHLETFLVSDPAVSSDDTGTEVVITDVTTNLSTLTSPTAHLTLAQHFAPYLINYPDAVIIYDGVQIDPEQAILDRAELDPAPVRLSGGRNADVSLTILEWKSATVPAFVLCDENGFPRLEIGSGMQGLGYDFTAYLKCAEFRELDESNVLILSEMEPDVQKLVESGRERVRGHFLQKTARASVDFVERWQKEHVYPYSGPVKSPVERVERQVFDMLAFSLNNYLPGFEKAGTKQKQFAMRLLKHAVETGPSEILTIMEDVLDLPAGVQAEIKRLLEKTTLSAIINAAKVVADRQDFLQGLSMLLFDADTKKKLLERKQLHKILETETWIFGEEYNLTASDKGMTQVLEKHLALLGARADGGDPNGPPVTLPDGSRGIVDLMLSRKVQQIDKKWEHLIVELKRPTQKIDEQVLSQISEYALAVAEDERFRNTDAQWTFWALANDVSPGARRMSNQLDRPPDLYFASANIKIWVKTWSQVIESCRSRLSFYEAELRYDADDASALVYLNAAHNGHLPQHLQPVTTQGT